jgi:hypothetical protein
MLEKLSAVAVIRRMFKPSTHFTLPGGVGGRVFAEEKLDEIFLQEMGFKFQVYSISEMELQTMNVNFLWSAKNAQVTTESISGICCNLDVLFVISYETGLLVKIPV